VLSAWSLREEIQPGPLAAAADVLARSAETVGTPQTKAVGKRVAMPSATGTAFLMLAAAGRGPAAELAVLTSVLNLIKALHDVHEANGEALRARRIETVVRGQLAAVAGRLDTAARTAGPASGAPSVAAGAGAVDPQAAEAARLARAAFGAPAKDVTTKPAAPSTEQTPRPRQDGPSTGPSRDDRGIER